MTIYYEGWKEKEYSCSECDWQGSGASGRPGHFHRKMFLELFCPKCGEFLDLIIFPYPAGCGNDTETLADEQIKVLQEQEEQMRLYLEQCLHSPEQLPDIDAVEFTLLWDQVEGETHITLSDRIIWSEPLAYEGFDRYGKIALILHEKYGSRLKDLIPADRSLLFLYGDFASSIDYVKKVRKELFGV